jgi:murein DD-endopeptidase MepM/ murein hydrolase activator NlpD
LTRLLVAIVMLPLLTSLVGPAPVRGDELADAIARQQELAARVKSQRAEAARIRSLQGELARTIAATRSALAGINADLAATKASIAQLSEQIAAVQSSYEKLVAEVNLLDRQVVAIEEEQVEKGAELQHRRDLLAARIRDAYRVDRTPLLQAVLSADTFTDLVEDVGAFLDLGAQDRALAAQIEADVRTLAALRTLLLDTRTARDELREETLAQKRELDARLSDLEDARRRLAALQAETERQLAIRRANHAQMVRTERNLEAAIARTVAAEKQLQRRIDTLVARQRSLGNIPSQYNGTLTWPLVGLITQEFGCTGFHWNPPRGNCRHFHEGIDIAAAMYTPIRASGAGVVVFAGPNPWDPPPRAWIVIVAHSESLQTWYAHVDNAVRPPIVREGQAVAAGDILAFVGMTGRTTGQHLHWAVRYERTFVNPRLFL